MQENYKAWEVKIEDFFHLKSNLERLRFLLNFAVLAPSSHNSQPWKFRVSENEILVEPNRDRALPSSDTNNRQLFISLGCAVENILIAADYYGFETLVEYLSGHEQCLHT